MTKYPLRHVNRSLAGKLILSIGILILLGGGISWYLLISASQRNLKKDALENAASYSDLVRKSIRYSMLTFHPEAIQQTLEEIGSRKGIEGLRIFDSRGNISYSSEKAEIGRKVDSRDTACIGCHDSRPGPALILPHNRQWVIDDKAGYRVLTFIE